MDSAERTAPGAAAPEQGHQVATPLHSIAAAVVAAVHVAEPSLHALRDSARLAGAPAGREHGRSGVGASRALAELGRLACGAGAGWRCRRLTPARPPPPAAQRSCRRQSLRTECQWQRGLLSSPSGHCAWGSSQLPCAPAKPCRCAALRTSGVGGRCDDAYQKVHLVPAGSGFGHLWLGLVMRICISEGPPGPCGHPTGR